MQSKNSTPNSRLSEIRKHRKLSQPALANKLGATSQWISLLETGQRQLTEQIMRRLADALDIDPADLLSPIGTPLLGGGLREAEAVAYTADNAVDIQAEFARLHPGVNRGEVFEIRSPALNLDGIAPGDLVFVDLNDTTPPNGTLCLAQRYSESGEAETIVRLLERPYLIARTTDRAYDRPLLLDDIGAQIMGRVLSSHRIYA